MVLGASTHRAFAQTLASGTGESEVGDPWVTRMRSLPTTVVSTTLKGPLGWPGATVVSGDAVDVVARLKHESGAVALARSVSMNRALMAASLVDRVQVTLFPALTGQTGLAQIFEGAAEGSLHMRRWRHPHIVRSARRSPSGLHVAAHRPPGSARRQTATSATRLPPI